MEVTFDQVNKRYGNFYAVKDFSLKINSGALHFLLGPSGCGKTTSLRMLAGLEKVSSGRIFFDDRDVTHLPAAERGIGMVFQNYALWPHMTVRKNIEYGLKLRKMSTSELNSRVEEVLSFTQLVRFTDRLPGQLSGGQQQRVALARALAIRPNVLLLDEPLSNLDAKLRLEMRDNISRIHRQTGITTVYVTHDQKEALSMGTDITVMHAGKLIQNAPPRELYHSPENAFIANFIGETNLVKGQVTGTGDGSSFVVNCNLGEIKAGRASFTPKVGDKVNVSVRPEAIGVHFDGKTNGADNTCQLKIDHLTYLGESEQFQVHDNDGDYLKITVFHAPEHNLKEGDTLTCSMKPEDVLLLPEGEDIGPRT